MATINPRLGKKLKDYGAVNFNACYNCGTCTAVCSLSSKEDSFPRTMVRAGVTGMDAEIKSSLKPWLCYYCGECTSNCPQTANPGELMMSLRRYLMAQYDWTGVSGLLFKSLPASIIAFILVIAGIIAYAFSMGFNLEMVMHTGHYFEMFAIGGVLVFILAPNIFRMWWFTIVKPKKNAPVATYFRSIGEFFIAMFTQKRALDCEDNKVRWFEHLILVIGYLALLFTTVFLDWFSTQNLFIILFGYVISAIVFAVTLIFVSDRIRKTKELSKFSHHSDWFFVAGLFLMGFTAFLVRLFIDFGLLQTNGWIYILHLITLASWALIIVPFGKWTHFLYRSFAMYFSKIGEGK